LNWGLSWSVSETKASREREISRDKKVNRQSQRDNHGCALVPLLALSRLCFGRNVF